MGNVFWVFQMDFQVQSTGYSNPFVVPDTYIFSKRKKAEKADLIFILCLVVGGVKWFLSLGDKGNHSVKH